MLRQHKLLVTPPRRCWHPLPPTPAFAVVSSIHDWGVEEGKEGWSNSGSRRRSNQARHNAGAGKRRYGLQCSRSESTSASHLER